MREVQKDGKPYGTEGREASETVSPRFRNQRTLLRPPESGDAPQALSIWARCSRPLKST